MNCSRCRGLMIVDSFIDLQEDTGQLWLSAWRCVNCGQVHDPGVIRNRLAPRCVGVADVKRLRSRPRVARAPIAIRASA
ncbi:MAG: hypothetical protein ABI945_04650 [Nitrospirales bacterium]